MPDLRRDSIALILAHQAPSGAWVASPSFANYRYSWLRDGAFIAHAMDRVGEHESASAFLRWVDRALLRYADKAERLLEKVARGEALSDDDCLHIRFTLAGEEAEGEWGNFQLDGYGSWLWALAEHVRLAGDEALVAEVAGSVDLTVRYLSALWRSPNNDCWEEHPELIHPHTLVAIYGGLRAAAGLRGAWAAQAEATAEEVRRFILVHGVRGGRLVKSLDPATLQPARSEADASLLGAVVPYRLLSPTDPIARATVAAIERDLHRAGGGVYRYLGDTYYGGGEWTLLAGWLGWIHVEMGETGQAREILAWIEAQADAEGQLPEQVSTHLLAPERYDEWVSRWGPVARPLLWSHAMYLILCDAIREGSDHWTRQSA